jgi:hypothetical protein
MKRSRFRRAAYRVHTPDQNAARHAATARVSVRSLAKLLFLFATTMQLGRGHPLQGGILRLKHPFELRRGPERPPVWLFRA